MNVYRTRPVNPSWKPWRELTAERDGVASMRRSDEALRRYRHGDGQHERVPPPPVPLSLPAVAEMK